MAHPPVLGDPLSRLLQLGGELVTLPGQPRRKFDLAHMRALLAALGNPHLRFPSVLIAGTNGKGSTAATLASILASAGYRVGLYTSPHLTRVNERIQFLEPRGAGAPAASAEIDDTAIARHLDHVEVAYTALVADGSLPAPPSFFEALTAVAMLAFAAGPATSPAFGLTAAPASASPVDIAILEVGMGGRLDATNVVEPLLSVITDISLDHTEWLGPTITDIAREKAGILRPGGTMITLPQHPEANQALGEVAVALGVRGINAADYLPGRDYLLLAGSAADAGDLHAANRYTLQGVAGLDPGNPAALTDLHVDSPLRGQHQQRNLALAIAAAIALSSSNGYNPSATRGVRNSNGYNLSAAHIEQGIRHTRWPGRLEYYPPAASRPAVILDVAHNPAGAWALRAAIGDWSSAEFAPRSLVFGCMRDKAVAEMAHILFPIFDRVFLTELPSPRSASIAELVEVAERTGVHYDTYPTPGAALESALSVAQPGSLLVVGGSVVLVGAAREQLGERNL